MKLERLRWLAIVLPIAFIVLIEAVEGVFFGSFGARSNLIGAAIIVPGVVAFSFVVFRLLTRMQHRIVQQNEELAALSADTQALYEIGLKIASSQDIQEILSTIVERARALLGAELAAVCLAQGNGRGRALAAYSGPESAFGGQPVKTTIPYLGPAGVTAAYREPEMAACVRLSRAYRMDRLARPLLVGNTVLGDMCVCRPAGGAFAHRHRELLAGLADMAAIAVQNARLLDGERSRAVLEERERLAREMHDSIAQVLGQLHLKGQIVRRLLGRQETDKAREELDEIVSLAHESYVDVREAILGLRETVTPAIGLEGAIRQYLQKFSRQAGISAELTSEADMPEHLSPGVEVQVLRVIQEALTNVRKHAEASRAWIHIGQTNGDICSISVTDDGRGFDLVNTSLNGGDHFGVATMRERMERIGGRLEIDSKPGYGTTVTAYLPSVEERL